MKKILILLIVSSVANLACRKNDVGSIDYDPNEIYGKWKLSEIWQDQGDGSGEYIKVSGANRYLFIDRTGKISGDALPDLISFKVIDNATIEVFSKTYRKSIPYIYKVSEGHLTLNPPCFEGCGFRFLKE